jgi:Resolvase, N terminal domain
VHRGRDVPRGLSALRVEVVPRKRNLPEPVNGSTLPTMVGAVIYVRMSTKEQTENLSRPTQLRACEEYCRREGYEILERFREEGESQRRPTVLSCSGSSSTAGRTRTKFSMGKCLVHDPKRAPLVRRAFEDDATGHDTKEHLLKQARAPGLVQPSRSATHVAGDWHAAAESVVRRDRGRPGVRRSWKEC